MMVRAIAAAVIFTASLAWADETFVATLIPRLGTGSTGSGSGTIVLSSDETFITYNITMSGLSGPEVAAHIHRADGSIAHELPVGSPKVGVWNHPGLLDVFALRGETLFILVHTQANPGGELRGNILKPDVAVENTTWGAIKGLFDSP